MKMFGAIGVCAVTALLLVTEPAIAQNSAQEDDDGFRSADDIPNIIESANTPKESRVNPPVSQTFMERWGAFKPSLDEAAGIKFSLAKAKNHI